MPAGVGLANWMIPMMIGAPDMAMPRMNNMSFWILPFAFTLLLSTFFMPGGAPAGGWTMYPPLIFQLGDGFPFLIFAIHFLGISSIMGAINIIATVINMRAPHMTYMKLPLFVWTWIITAFLLIAAMPVFAGAVTMLLTDKFFGTAFFDAAGGGDPLMFQHLFWFFGHLCSSIFSGSLVTLRCIFWFCHHLVLFPRLSRPFLANRCSVIHRWFSQRRRLHSCRFLSGHTTCLPSGCRW
jgi:cytochrome c oxidase subunit 1